MNAITAAEPPVSAETMELVLGSGELSKLTPKQRVEWTLRLCQSMGLNPMTRPIRFLKLGPEVVAYVTRDGTDQLRRLHKVSLQVVNQSIDGAICTVHVRATMPDGRADEDFGVTVLPPAGELRANGIMKAIAKGKRRVTLSIVGLGFLGEDEHDTLPNAQILPDDAPEPTPEPKTRPKALPPERRPDAAPPKPDFVRHRRGAEPPQPKLPMKPDQEPEPTHVGDVVEYPFIGKTGNKKFATGSDWIAEWRRIITACQQNDILDRLHEGADRNLAAINAVRQFDPLAAAEVNSMLATALSALPSREEMARTENGDDAE